MNTHGIDNEHINLQRIRSNAYALLGRLLAAPVDADLLQRLGAIDTTDAPSSPAELSSHWSSLQQAAVTLPVEHIEREYHALFIGLGLGEIIPYASRYLTGFLNDRPLAQLRGDLRALGFERQSGVCEPEDHAAALLEVMSLLIEEETAAATTAKQTRFLRQHIANWMPAFFNDLANAPSARFYQAVAQLGAALLNIEAGLLNVPIPRFDDSAVNQQSSPVKSTWVDASRR